MCGRYNFSVEESATLREIVRQIESQRQQAQWRPGEIFPTNTAPVLLEGKGGPVPALLGWGYPGREGRAVINARAETAGERPLFCGSLHKRRCAVPASGFYEWDSEKQKFLFRLPGEDALFMAGLWDVSGGERRFCILTTAANESVAAVHSRMPLVLPRAQIPAWLHDGGAARALLQAVPPQLQRQCLSAQTKLW